MKKVFVEPEMKKIELNLSENIAESHKIVFSGFYFNEQFLACTVQYSGKKLSEGVPDDQLLACYAESDGATTYSRGRVFVPEETVRMYIRY